VPDAGSDTLVHLDAAALARRLADGSVSATAAVEAFIARIHAIDDAGPTLNAVIEINPEIGRPSPVAVHRELWLGGFV